MDLLHQEKTEIIIGIMYDVYNELGYGYREKYYERAILSCAKRKNIKVKSQLYLPVQFLDTKIGYSKVDVLFFDYVLVELKVGKSLTMKDFKQLNEYLKLLNKEVGLLVLYSPIGVIVRRVVNIKS